MTYENTKLHYKTNLFACGAVQRMSRSGAKIIRYVLNKNGYLEKTVPKSVSGGGEFFKKEGRAQ